MQALIAAIIAAWLVLAAPAFAARDRVTTLNPSYEVIVERNVVVEMSDGTPLVADIYRPRPRRGQPAGQRFPCLFEMTPYRKELRAAEGAEFFVPRGFILMELDARGTGGSAGNYDGVFLPAEQRDGYDAIEWMATEYPHCNGRVGMWGGSYSGINQYLVATSPKGRPPHLRTIAPQRAYSDLYRDIVHTGGLLTGSFGLLWSGATTGFNAVGADPTTFPDPEMGLRAITEHLSNHPMLLTYLNAPFDGPLYRRSSLIWRLRQLQIPTFHLVGLFDAFTRGQLKAIGRLLELERAGRVRGPHYAIVGPWNHSGAHFLTHPPYDRWILDWYRHWLDRGPRPAWFDLPRVTYCEMAQARDGDCRWRRAEAWPPRGIRYRRLYLGNGGKLTRREPGGSGPVGSWTWNPLAGQGEDLFSKWDNAASVPQRDADQASEDEWKGLVFTTPVLRRPIRIAGPIVLSLRAETHPIAAEPGLDLAPLAELLGLGGVAELAPPYHDTDFVVKLSEVAPNGRSNLIQSGFLRASHLRLDPRQTRRVGAEVTEPVPFHVRSRLSPPRPGAVRTYKIEIWPTAKQFRVGHRLRIALYSADTANHLTLLKPAVNTVHAGSYLLLPEQRR